MDIILQHEVHELAGGLGRFQALFRTRFAEVPAAASQKTVGFIPP